MTDSAPESRRQRAIENSLERGRRELPALVPLFDAFGPLLLAQARICEAAPGWTGQAPEFDPERYCQGAFLLSDAGFEDMSGELPAAAAALLPVMEASFPALAGELQVLATALASGALPARTLAAAAFGEAAEIPGLGRETLAFAAGELTRPFVQRQAQDLLALVKDLPWRQNFCPVCGAAPNMSVLRRLEEENEFIKSHGGKKFLRCSCCASEWAHKRVSCPACGCEEPDELVILRAPDREHERADACTRCKTFVPCLDTGELAEAPDPDVAAIAMIPLGARARAEGYSPVAGHPWGGL